MAFIRGFACVGVLGFLLGSALIGKRVFVCGLLAD